MGWAPACLIGVHHLLYELIVATGQHNCKNAVRREVGRAVQIIPQLLLVGTKTDRRFSASSAPTVDRCTPEHTCGEVCERRCVDARNFGCMINACIGRSEVRCCTGNQRITDKKSSPSSSALRPNSPRLRKTVARNDGTAGVRCIAQTFEQQSDQSSVLDWGSCATLCGSPPHA